MLTTASSRLPAAFLALLTSSALLAACGGGGSANGGSAGACATGAAAAANQITVAQEPDGGVSTPAGKCWASVPPTTMAVLDVGTAVSGTSATFKVAWSKKDLYILADTQVWPINNAGGANWWQSDATEFGVSGSDSHSGAFTSGNTYQLAITSDGTLQTSGDNGTNANPAPGAIAKIVANKGFYTELVVPWGTLQVSAPAKGQKYQFDIGQDFGDSSGNRLAQMVWQANPAMASTSDWHQDTSQWGDITLG